MADVISLLRQAESNAVHIVSGGDGLSIRMGDFVTAGALLVEGAQNLCHAQLLLENIVRKTIDLDASYNLAGNRREA
ncbi:hypothetical protein [Shinella granuli]|uniref:Uncharacterized protein n=1 Tax=Shinella granuli TaxID=323621 RepID=A0A4R2C7D3_SHIGR|nr:hypothetical protein [Shinella granuli]TCN34749.1 hypothetical protein EV665_13234 [Shinella granuli]